MSHCSCEFDGRYPARSCDYHAGIDLLLERLISRLAIAKRALKGAGIEVAREGPEPEAVAELVEAGKEAEIAIVTEANTSYRYNTGEYGPHGKALIKLSGKLHAALAKLEGAS